MPSTTNTPFAVELRVQGQSVAFAHPRPSLGYLQREEVRWVDLSAASIKRQSLGKKSLLISARARDEDGADWTYRQMFRAESPSVIVTETTVSVNQDRAVVYLPMHMLIAGENPSAGAKARDVLVNGFTSAPRVRVNGAVAPNEFHAAEGRLILKLVGDSRVDIER